MIGKTFSNVRSTDDELYFDGPEGDSFCFYHEQDCCEHVYIEDICGDLRDLVGHPILQADEEVSEGEVGEYDYSSTWTFYKFATIKGSVTVRWLGTSNGYYSESVNLRRY